MGQPSTLPSSGPSRMLSEEDITEANRKLDRVFALLGLVADGKLVCPACGTAKAKKVEFKQSKTGAPYWKCWRCGEHGSATKLYMERTGANFPEAVNTILDRQPAGRKSPQPVAPLPEITITPSFTADWDIELYDAVLAAGNLRAAADYWGIWHISPEAVAEAGSRAITNAQGLERLLLRRFGRDRLIASGLMTETKRGDYMLVNKDYPIIEAQRLPDGRVSAMQFRPSVDQRVKVEAHKAFKRTHGEGAEGGPKYVTPFLSPKGARAESLIGYGLQRAATLQPGTPVYVVEGLKDLLAARTLRPNTEFVAIPGTGVMPPEIALEVLRKLKVYALLDGDEAGAAGRTKLVAYLREHGVEADEVTDVRPGMDVCDLLVERHAKTGCACATCTLFRELHPDLMPAVPVAS